MMNIDLWVYFNIGVEDVFGDVIFMIVVILNFLSVFFILENFVLLLNINFI